MAKAAAYLHFHGQCAEAFEFYKSCFGGVLELDKVGDTPMAQQMPESEHQKVMHCSLTSGDFVVMGSDMSGSSDEPIPGNMHSIAVMSDSVDELKSIFKALADGGTVGHEITVEFFGTYGDLTDKYGVNWMFQSDSKAA